MRVEARIQNAAFDWSILQESGGIDFDSAAFTLQVAMMSGMLRHNHPTTGTGRILSCGQMIGHLQTRNTVLHPVWRFLAFEIVIEPLTHTTGIILLIDGACQTVVLAHVFQQNYFLAELAECVEMRDALIEINRAVFVVVQQNQRRLLLLRVECRRVANVGLVVIREIAFETTLTAFEDCLVRAAGIPVDGAVHADQSVNAAPAMADLKMFVCVTRNAV